MNKSVNVFFTISIFITSFFTVSLFGDSSSVFNDMYFYAIRGTQIVVANSQLGNINISNGSRFIISNSPQFFNVRNFSFIIPVVIYCVCLYMFYRSVHKKTIRTVKIFGVKGTQTIDLTGKKIDHVNVSGRGELIIQQINDSDESCVIQTDANIFKFITHEIKDNCLIIAFKLPPRTEILGTLSLLYNLRIKNMHALNLSHSMNAKTQDNSLINTDSLKLCVQHSSHANLQLNLQKLTANVQYSSSAQIIIAQKAQELMASINHSSNLSVVGPINSQDVFCCNSSVYSGQNAPGEIANVVASNFSNVTVNIVNQLTYNGTNKSHIKFVKNSRFKTGLVDDSSLIEWIGKE